MKKDCITLETKLATVWCSNIKLHNQGILVTFVDVLTGEEYEHFQPTPADSGRGESKARKYLRQLARSADLENDYLVLDFTQEAPLRDVRPIVGRVFQIFIKVKKALPGQYIENSRYKSAESIWHYEGDGEFNLQTALYVMSRNTDELRMENLLGRLVSARKTYATKSFEDYQNLLETLATK